MTCKGIDYGPKVDLHRVIDYIYANIEDYSNCRDMCGDKRDCDIEFDELRDAAEKHFKKEEK